MEGISAHYQLLLITGFLCFKIWKRFDISDDSIMLLMFDICWLYLDIRWHWVPSSQAHTSSNRRRRRRVWRTPGSEIHSCQGDSWDRLLSGGRTVAGRSVLAGCSHTVNTAAQWRGQGDSSRQHTGHTTDLQSLCNSSQISVKWRHIKHSQSSKPVGCNSNCTLTDLVLPRPALSLAVGRWPSVDDLASLYDCSLGFLTTTLLLWQSVRRLSWWRHCLMTNVSSSHERRFKVPVLRQTDSHQWMVKCCKLRMLYEQKNSTYTGRAKSQLVLMTARNFEMFFTL